MAEFRGVVNFNDRGEVVCFCSMTEVLQGKCSCQERDDCPEAIINIEIVPGTKPSERKAQKARKVTRAMVKDFGKIQESLGKLEKVVKNSRFRI